MVSKPTVQLGDICKPQQWATIGSSELTEAGYRVHGANCFIGYYSEANHTSDVVAVSCRGENTGNVIYIPGPSYVTGNAMCLDDLDESKADARWLCEFLKLRGLRDIISGSAQPQIIQKDLARVKIALPPLAEQRKIAEILRTWDEAIETAEAELKAKQERKRVLMEKLLKPSAEDAVRGSKAKNGSENFLKSRVGEVAELKNGYAFKSQQYDVSGPYRVITISNVQEGRLDATSCKFIKHAPDDLKQHHRLDVGDMLISMTGNVGRVCRVNESGFLLNQRVGRIIPKNIDDGFFYYVLASESFRDRMVELAQGGAQPNLSVGDILDYVFVHPASLQAQQMIAEILQVADADIELINKRAEDLRTQKRGLMQKLLTGEVRVAA